ncbi:MAG: L-threonylcarbamoyladenylate synthase [Candidatus Omnitrophota bacterium]
MKRTVVLQVNPERPDKRSISLGAGMLRSGGLVAFPTETVYGLGANLLDEKAIARLCRVKHRPKGKQFTVHIENISAIKKLKCEIPPAAGKLIDKYWPGPLTIILKSKDGARTGFRMPANAVALALIRQAKVPVVAPSANISGRRPPTGPEGVLKQLAGRIDLLLDAGPSEVGVESTVVDMTVSPPQILRAGAIKRVEIFKALNPKSEYRI